MIDLVTNFGKATVSIGYTSGDTSIVLTSGHGAKFPSASSSDNTTHFNVVWYNSTDYPDPADDPNVEIVRVTNRSTDTLTVTRAQEGTSATNKNTAGKTYKMILAPTRKTILDLQIKEPSQYSFIVTHPSASRDSGVGFTLGTFMKYGMIKEITLRGSYTMGTLYAWSALASSPTTGIIPGAGSFAYYGNVGSIFVGDYVGIDNEIMRVSGTTTTYLTVTRGTKGTSKSFHNHVSLITKMVNGVRIQIFKDSLKMYATKILEISNINTYSGITSGSIFSGGTVIRLTASPRNLDNFDRVIVQDNTSETMVVQAAFGSVVGTTHDNTIFVKGSFNAIHVSAKNVQKIAVYDNMTSYKGSSNTLYGNLFVDERVPAGGTIIFSVGIKADKYGSIALG